MAQQQLDIVEQVQLDGGRRQLTMNMGPQHPSTHGVLRVVLNSEDEDETAARTLLARAAS